MHISKYFGLQRYILLELSQTDNNFVSVRKTVEDADKYFRIVLLALGLGLLSYFPQMSPSAIWTPSPHREGYKPHGFLFFYSFSWSESVDGYCLLCS